MVFSEIETAVALTGTELDSTIIESLRDAAEEEIVDKLTANSLNVPASNATLKQASIMLTCRNILQRQKLDGSTPNILRAGNYYENTAVDQSIADYEKRGYALLSQYMYGDATINVPLIYLG